MTSTTFSSSRAWLIILITLMLGGAAQAQSVTQTPVSTNCQNNPQCVTGNGYFGATRLDAHDRVVIKATELGGTTYGQCRAVLNNGSTDIFIPWRTPQEWSAFLSAVLKGTNMPQISVSQCCAPLNATVCGNPVTYPNTTTPVPLGYRTLGVLSGDTTPTPNWGAETDIMGPLAAPAPADYQVTYVCSSGSWIKTHEVGSCTPTNGYCSGLDGTYVKNFPVDPSTFTETLCAPGSIFDTAIGLSSTATGWAWQCDGTQGMTNASCTAYKQPPANGACGPIENTNGTGVLYSLEQLQQLNANAPTQLCNSGSFAGNFRLNGLYWNWTCTGVDGGSNANCATLSSTSDGQCGSDNGHTYTTPVNNPRSALPSSIYLCSGYNNTVTWLSGAPGTPFNGVWSWTCGGLGGGATSPVCNAYYNPALTNGSCGSDNGGVYADGTLMPTDPNLCATGTASNFGAHPGANPYWTWSCDGAAGGSSSWCSAYDVTAINGKCGPQNLGTYDSISASDATLCASGTMANFSASTNNAPYFWEWGCYGSGSGSNSWCAVHKTAAQVTAACGAAQGSSTTTPPSSGTLCAIGNPSGVSHSSDSAQWLWSCVSLDGATTTNCSASITPPVADGTCGATNGTAIPNTPNYNLCATGTPSALSGNGPWTWTCLGSGGGSNSGQCTALMCNACTGTTTRTQTAARTASASGCTITGVASWTETDTIIPGSANSALVGWSDAFGKFSSLITPTAASYPTYCPPCYMQAQSVQNAHTTVTSTAGSCGTITTGTAIPATGVTVQ